jgi:macrolide transport system ATP-binding/permease protein
MRGLNWIDNAFRDFRYAIRQLRKSPGFAGAVSFVLALGISAAVIIFGLVEAALIKPLPYRDQSRLVGSFEESRSFLSFQNFTDWKRLNTVFSSIDAYALNGGFTLSTGAGAEPVAGTRVSAGFFRTLGVSPALGRDFRADEDSPAAGLSVMISYGAWQKRFGGRTDILGQAVTLNGIPRTIIGVLPREFHFAPYGAAEFWATLRNTDPCEQNRGCHNLNTVARLKDGISMETASAEINLIVRQLQRQYPGTNLHVGSATLVPLRDVVVGKVRPILLVLMSGAGVLLLIAYVNVTTLLLARSDSRRREIAVRGALGATSARLFHQFAIEGLVLAAAGGTLALFIAEWGMRVLAGLVPASKLDSMPYLRTLGSNFHTVAFGCSLSLLAGVLFAILPTVRTSLSERMEGLKEATRGTAGIRWRRFGANLVVAEVALAMVLMTGAGLLGKSLYALLRVETGMRPDHLASVGLHWPPARYSSDEEKVALGRRIVERISALPGVVSVAISLTSPVGSAWGTTSFHVVGRPNRREQNEVLNRQVSSAYFATLQARLIRGRYFRDAEDGSKPRVAIINRVLAAKYFGGEDPVGKQIYHDWAPRLPMEVVGIVDDIKEGPLENENLPVLYVPFDQNPVAWFAILVRTSPAEQSTLTAIPGAIHQIDRDISVNDPVTMTERIHNSPAAYLHRSSAWLVGGFASVAFVLGVVGLYGVVAYSVSRRTREIGIRMALGAEPRSVYRLIVGEAARLVGAGTVLGIGGSIAAATFLRGLFYGVRAWDAPTLTIVVAVLIVAALLASYIPARRAAAVNPVEALRSE